jgi:hypothetical protein
MLMNRAILEDASNGAFKEIHRLYSSVPPNRKSPIKSLAHVFSNGSTGKRITHMPVSSSFFIKYPKGAESSQVFGCPLIRSGWVLKLVVKPVNSSPY